MNKYVTDNSFDIKRAEQILLLAALVHKSQHSFNFKYTSKIMCTGEFIWV